MYKVFTDGQWKSRADRPTEDELSKLEKPKQASDSKDMQPRERTISHNSNLNEEEIERKMQRKQKRKRAQANKK